MSGELAHTVRLEKDQVRVAWQEELSQLTDRVTHFYRREEGSLKLIHLLGDAIVEKTEATAVLQRWAYCLETSILAGK